MKHHKISLLPAILCGGAGTRLWPLSREERPKQLLPLTGPETMLQAAIRRMSGFIHENVELTPAPLVICNEEHYFLVAEQIRDMGIEGTAVILEPLGRNTAPALTVAALQAAKSGGDRLLLVMPADQVVEDRDAFHRAVSLGVQPALSGAIVTFGIVPDRPETGYGYIQAGRRAATEDLPLPIIRFVEKPDRSTAEAYLAKGGYYWNSGIFLLKAGTWLKAVEHLQAAMLTSCSAAFERGRQDLDFLRLDREAFCACPAGSIDCAVMENLGDFSDPSIHGVMVPLNAGWSDVGAWDAVWRIGRKDNCGNTASGDVFMEDTRQSLVLASSRLVSCVGLDGFVVVETPDAVLVAKADKAQDVGKIVAALKAKGRREGASHRKEYRSWGWHDTLEQGDRFQVRRISVNPGAVLGPQLHLHSTAHWIIVKGTAKIALGEERFLLRENQSIVIQEGEKHRLENPGQSPLEIIEVRSGTDIRGDAVEEEK